MLHAALAASVGLAAVGLALVVLNVTLLPRLPAAGPAPAGGRRPRVSVVIPARNEERDVEDAVRSHLRQDYPDFEVIVVDDRSADATSEILDRLAREDRRLTVVEGVEPPAGWLGKPHALAQGADAASGELLLFADADVRYHPHALSEAVSYMQTRGIDLLALLPRLSMRGFWENVLMPYLLVAFFEAPGFLANWRRPRWIAAGGGSGNLVRRAVYDAVGGHAALRASVVDDVRLGFAVKLSGHRFGIVRAEERVSVRMYRGFREVVDGFTKNIAYIYQGALGPPLFVFTLATLGAAILPPAALLAALLGAKIPTADLVLAAEGYAIAVASRLALAAAVGDPLWPAPTHPIMAAVWSGILARSLYQRFVRRRLTWRGREFEARSARF
ncbi:MAG: glycosyltransferase [Acidobacteriota bacterium]